MKKLSIRIILLCFLALITSGCLEHFFNRTDVQQGNILEPEKMLQVHRGMSKDEVAFILGNPVYEDPFTTNRWDYVYTSQVHTSKMTLQHVTYVFANNRLEQIIS